MNSPNISPRRRRRIFRAHQLRQDGLTLEQIAEQLDVSVATVHADLRLLEEHWVVLAQDIHDDLLLQQIARLDRRVERLSRLDPIADVQRALGPDAELNLEQLGLIEDRHERRLAQAGRELRMLLKQLHNRHDYRSTRSADAPDEELADPETAPRNLKEPETQRTAIARKTLEIVPPEVAEKNSSTTPQTPIDLPRDTGRNQPCPCGSGRKRKRCHPQHSNPPPPAPARIPPLPLSPRGAGGDAEGRGGLTTPATGLPPDREAEALHLTQRAHEARANGDPIAQLNALDKLVDLYGSEPTPASTTGPR